MSQRNEAQDHITLVLTPRLAYEDTSAFPKPTFFKPEAARSLFPRLIDRNHHFWRLLSQPNLTPAKNFDKAHNIDRLCASKGRSFAPMYGRRGMRRALFASILFGLLGSSVVAQDRKGIRFWNLTLYTITSFQMSPGGKDSWGHDQCKNDRDGTVDHDERLRITGVEPGRADKIGRVCVVRNVEVREGAPFSIEERQLTECGR